MCAYDVVTMSSAGEQDLSWRRRPFIELLRLSWPITLSMLSYSIMTLVDTVLVSHLGAPSLAGVGLAGTAAFVLLCFPMGILRGAKTLVAQAVGADRRGEIGSYLGASLLSAAGLGVLIVALGSLLAEGLRLISASPEAGAAARTYLVIRNLGAPLVLVQVALREVRYGQGDAHTPMMATIVANLVNIGLAYFFIRHLGWGVPGAAVATLIAQAVEAGVLAEVQHRLGWQVRATRWEHVRALWAIGLPTGLQFMLEMGSFSLLAAFIAALSEVQMAAHQIAIQIIHFSFLPAYAVSEAASVLVGQAVGAGRDDLVLGVARRALLLTSIYTFACTLVLALGAPIIISPFHPSAALSEVAVRLLHVAAVFQIFDGANMVARGALRGTGDVRPAAVVGVVTAWLMTPPLMWLLGYRLGLGALGGWLGLCGEIILGSLILWWRLERRSWHAAAERSRQDLLRGAAAAA